MYPRRIQKKKGLAGRIFYWLIFLAFISEIIYILFFSDFLNISKIEIRGTKEVDPQLIRNIIDSQISGKYLKFVDKNNLLLLSSEKTKNLILNDFKKIKNIEIKKDFKKNLFINIAERESKMIFCSGSCYIADEDGIIFLETDLDLEKAKENKLLIFTSENNKNLSLKDKVIEPEFMEYLFNLKEKLQNSLNLEIDQGIRTPQMISGDIRVKTVNGWMIYFNKEISLEKEIEMLRAVLENNIDRNRMNDLEYIDLRTDNKVYFKYKNSETTPALEDKKIEEPEKKTEEKNGKKKKT